MRTLQLFSYIKQATEWKVATLGIVCAASSSVFAWYMIENSDRAPALTGNENFALFARPSNGTGKDPLIRYNPPEQAVASRAIESDSMPVGSILPRSPQEQPSAPKPPMKELAGFFVRGSSDGKVLVQGPNGFELVGPGDRLADAGTVLSIKYDKGNWVVLTETGSIASHDQN